MPSVPAIKLLKMLFLCSGVVNKCPEGCRSLALTWSRCLVRLGCLRREWSERGLKEGCKEREGWSGGEKIAVLGERRGAVSCFWRSPLGGTAPQHRGTAQGQQLLSSPGRYGSVISLPISYFPSGAWI